MASQNSSEIFFLKSFQNFFQNFFQKRLPTFLPDFIVIPPRNWPFRLKNWWKNIRKTLWKNFRKRKRKNMSEANLENFWERKREEFLEFELELSLEAGSRKEFRKTSLEEPGFFRNFFPPLSNSGFQTFSLFRRFSRVFALSSGFFGHFFQFANFLEKKFFRNFFRFSSNFSSKRGNCVSRKEFSPTKEKKKDTSRTL